ncbi:MAG: sugar phosphate nucleotidyltransferase [Gemmatimonadota bacterium]
MMNRAVILAAGRGTRMQAPDPAVELSPAQAAAATAGHKMLVPIHGRPYIAYVLHELAEAGYAHVCLVVGADDDAVRSAVLQVEPRRLHIEFAVQPEPLGGADAVLAAEPVVGCEPFALINADNLYPAPVLARLRELDGPGLAAFERQTLVRMSNIPAARVASFALIEERDGLLTGIVEKPETALVRRRPDARVSMTCWRFGPAIFDACRDVEPSERGELELPDAVALALERGERFRVLPVAAGVLDLSRRADIPAVERLLTGKEPRP